MQRRSLLLLVPILLAVAACQTVVSDDRVDPGATVTVSNSDSPFGEEFGENCPPSSAVEILVDDEVVATGTADDTGHFEIDITAPDTPADYSVVATCTPAPTEEVPDPAPVVLDPADLLVEPPLEMEVDPSTVAPGGEFEVTGNWCISDQPLVIPEIPVDELAVPLDESEEPVPPTDSRPPVVAVTFEGETTEITADEHQPFGQTWSLTLTAPAAPGTYPVTATCTYDDVVFYYPEIPTGPLLMAEGPLVEEDPPVDSPIESGTHEFPPAEVTVVAPTTSTSSTSSTTSTTMRPAAVAPAAQARGVQPSYTG